MPTGIPRSRRSIFINIFFIIKLIDSLIQLRDDLPPDLAQADSLPVQEIGHFEDLQEVPDPVDLHAGNDFQEAVVHLPTVGEPYLRLDVSDQDRGPGAVTFGLQADDQVADMAGAGRSRDDSRSG
jgi:hypothetical protein